MLSYANLRDEISHIRQLVMLNLFGLVCKELNTEMYTRTDNLRLGLIKFQVRREYNSAHMDWGQFLITSCLNAIWLQFL